MRELIRPTLFIVARLGLFLAVVAWIVGQWSCFNVGFGTPAGGAQIVISHFGLQPQCSNSPNRFIAEIRHYDRTRWDKNFHDFPISWRTGNSWSKGTASGSWALLVIRHWLVVTIFALFNGVLMWVYRKRGKELAADE